jgi:nicotinate phosphoribosyltransferase
MISTIPKTHLFTPEDLHLTELIQIFSACEMWYYTGMKDAVATFDLLIRDAPKRNFLLFAGLEEVVKGISEWKYTKEEVDYLLKYKRVTPEFGKYMRKLRFTGDVYAMPEGTVFFPGEPVIRITAPIIEANMFTFFLLEAVTSNTIFLSKVIRPVIAAQPKKVLGGGTVRTHAFEATMKGRRAAHLCGVGGDSDLIGFKRKFNLPCHDIFRNAFHAFISSYPSELEAMRTACKFSNGKTSLMVDTYDFVQGVKNAVKVAKELEQQGKHLHGITVDSGDLLKNTKLARRMLDKAGLDYVKITVASNLDEYKINDLMKKKIPADAFLVGTEISTVADNPRLEVVYKIAEIRHKGNVKNLAKFSSGKESYPGRKQVFRVIKKGKFVKDILGLEDEKFGQPLLVPILKKGKLVYDLPTLSQIRTHLWSQVSQLPKKYLSVEKEYRYSLEISPTLKKMFEKVKQERVSKK